MSPPRDKIVLRDEHQGQDRRYLWAWLDEEGRLHIDGQDLGPGTTMASEDGEYEWFQTIAAEDLLRLVELLGGHSGEPILELLARRYTGERSYELERRLREGDIAVKRSVW